MNRHASTLLLADLIETKFLRFGAGRLDRRASFTTCRVARWRARKAATAAISCRAEAEPKAAASRRHRAV